jgi:hypothetical protein
MQNGSCSEAEIILYIVERRCGETTQADIGAGYLASQLLVIPLRQGIDKGPTAGDFKLPRFFL